MLQKKSLTEEEKKIKADLIAFRAEEMRKKKIRDRRTKIKQAMVDEARRSKTSMLEIHKAWRKIMRIAKVEELRNDIVWLSAKHVHQVEGKDHTIATFQRTLDEAEAQHQNVQTKHFTMLDSLIDLHYMRTKKMEEEFQSHLQRLEQEFSNERNVMTKTHKAQRKEMKDMLAEMKTEFDEAISEKRQEFETTREELKNKNTEDYNVLRISLEANIEELERRIEKTHETYLANTEVKTMSFKALVAKDAITARIIEQRMRRLIHLHETLAYWRVRIATNSKEWEEANKALRDEKDRLNKHYLDLKRTLDRLYTSEHQKLKAISKHVMNATKDLKNKLQLTARLQLLAKYNSRMETEAEKLFPFDPLHCSTIPTVPGMKLEQELALDDESGKEIREDSHSTVAVVATSMVVPSARHSSMMGVDIPLPSQDPEEPTSEGNPSDFRWSSYALDESGNEVEELSYLSKFNKRFNKVR
ncbi:hypothetical protein BDL97_06G038200 [Sphagnum fallax]|nr:hypothetical protein BDL97_06G038200 [Sphagnum fallax]